MPNLRTLNISYSRLSSTLPASFNALTQLQVLDVSYTYVMWPQPGSPRAVPPEWCSMTSLKLLRAEQAGLGGSLDALPVLNGCMPGLQRLYLGGNRDLLGSLPDGEK